MPIPISLLVLLFIFAEIATFVLVGQRIGAAATLGLALLAAAAGVIILRRLGTAVVMRARSELAAGRTPAGPLFDAAFLGLSALLLILPGFLTDIAGLALLMPATRRAIRSRLRHRSPSASTPRPRPAAGGVVELGRGEYSARPHDDSPWRSSPGDADRLAGK